MHVSSAQAKLLTSADVWKRGGQVRGIAGLDALCKHTVAVLVVSRPGIDSTAGTAGASTGGTDCERRLRALR